MGGVAGKVMTIGKRDVDMASVISVKNLTNNVLTFTNNSFLKVFT
jgi:hypothetical protein